MLYDYDYDDEEESLQNISQKRNRKVNYVNVKVKGDDKKVMNKNRNIVDRNKVNTKGNFNNNIN